MNFIKGKLIDGNEFAATLYKIAKAKTDELQQKHTITPGLAVIRVGEDAASAVYVKNKLKRAEDLGFYAQQFHFKDDISAKVLSAKIEHLNNDQRINGIIVQLPLPPHINTTQLINLIDPEKDVDGFTIQNVGRLHTWQDCLEPCTPTGIVMILKQIYQDLAGIKVTIIGRSLIVGRPLAGMLLKENCTIKILHSKTKGLEQETKDADVLITAVGTPNLIRADMVKDGACVIDIGITRDAATQKLVGDVDFEGVLPKVKLITPVPGGVGPVTVACLMLNTIKATCIQKKIKI